MNYTAEIKPSTAADLDLIRERARQALRATAQ